MICWSSFGWFLVDLEVENLLKIYENSIQKAIEYKIQVGMDFGWLLARFWDDFRAKLGSKLGLKLAWKGLKNDVTKWSKNESKKNPCKKLQEAQKAAESCKKLQKTVRLPGGGAYNETTKQRNNETMGIRHSTSCHKGTVAETCYIYMYMPA